MIELQSIEKTYQGKQKHQALKDINLKVERGEIFGVIGRSGAGKSTLVRCMNFLEQPTNGSVFIDGVDFTRLSSSQLRIERHQIGMIFQHFNLLESRNVFDNVALPLELVGQSKAKIREKVESLLTLVDLTDKQGAYPAELSGGQKQRVAIARALANEPKVLLSDEATSALDPETTQAILALLQKINQQLGLTIVLITHEMDVIKSICDRVAILDHGQLAEVASVIDLFVNPKTEVGQRFTEKALQRALPASLAEKCHQSPAEGRVPLVRFTFVGEQVHEPLLATIAEKFAVEANILQATLEEIQQQSVGITLCELLGNKADIEKAIRFSQEQGIQVEVQGYVTLVSE